MNRRKFLRIAALLGVGAAVSERSLAQPVATGVSLPTLEPLKQARITVVRRQCFTDLQSRYLDDPEQGPCSRFCEGQTFTSSGECPAGFCPRAWECIKGHVADVLSARSDFSCGEAPHDDAVIACCADGTRPVIFKITS